MLPLVLRLTGVFLSTPSARRATSRWSASWSRAQNFYPRPPRGGRRRWRSLSAPKGYFYPRPPRGGRPDFWHPVFPCEISIHALREEGDQAGSLGLFRPAYFYPRPPRGGRRFLCFLGSRTFTFLSTPSARRATAKFVCSECAWTDFYPRPPRGGRPEERRESSVSRKFLSTPSARRATRQIPFGQSLRQISIHALREEGDGSKAALEDAQAISIHALREEGDLLQFSAGSISGHISIHALREEGDRRFDPAAGCAGNFYPRPPRGGRPAFLGRSPRANRFLSTPSARRATDCHGSRDEAHHISIHALREEGDHDLRHPVQQNQISIHALREEGDQAACSIPRTCA